MQDHGLLEALGEFNLADKGLLLQFMWGAFQRVESALSHCKHLRQHKQFLKITECLIIMSGHIPWVQPGAQEMAILLRQRSATYAHQRRSRHLRQNMSMYIQNSQFSNLNSQFSILNSQISILKVPDHTPTHPPAGSAGPASRQANSL